MRDGKPAGGARPPSPEVRALEERFQASLGTRVRLKAGRSGGRVVIYYYSDEEFQALYQRLTGEDL
jgi:ParB family chromosome partitioning protein